MTFLVPIQKRGPFLIVKAEPLGATAVVGTAWRAPRSQFSARSFSRGAARKSGCGTMSWTRVFAGPRTSLTTIASASWATAEMSAWLGYCPRQDDRSRRRSSSGERLAKWIRAWGQCRACNRPVGLLARRAMHTRLFKGGLESQLSDGNRVALVGIAAYRMPVRNFMRWGQELRER